MKGSKKIVKSLFLHVNENKRQLTIFIMVGLANTLVDFIFYIILAKLFLIYFLISKIISFIVASMCSYSLNRKFTFEVKTDKTTREISRFYIIACLGLLVNAMGMNLFHGVLLINDLISFVGATGLTVLISFGFNKYWVFKRKD